MKKLSLRVLMSAVALCFMVQVSHGMKRSEPADPEPRGPHITVKPTAADTPQEIFPYSLFNDVYSCVLIPLFNLNPQNPKIEGEPIIQLRAVSRGFKKVMDSNTKHLDLSGFYWRPRDKRPQQNATFREGYDKLFTYRDGQLFFGKEKLQNCAPKPGHFYYGKGECSLHEQCPGYKTIVEWLLCKPKDGMTLWSSDKIYLVIDEKVQEKFKYKEKEFVNPLKTFFTDLSMDLTDFTNLTSLDLSSNTGCLNWDQRLFTNLTSLNLSDNGTSDDELSLFTNLTSLNLRNNKVITDKSVSCLTKLEALDLSVDVEDKTIAERYTKRIDKRFAAEAESRVPLKVLHALPNLKTLTVCPLRKDIGQCIRFPGLKVNFWSIDECPSLLIYQSVLHIADALFSYIENEMSEDNSSKISQLKNDYRKVILWPANKYNLTSEFLKPDSVVSMTAKEIKGLLNNYEDPDDGEYTYDYQVKVVNIVNELLEISKKDLNISYFNSEYEEDDNLLDPDVQW